ncbi:hypothetical protein RI367_000606 [Sorochytrium milnesiophthora]
MPDLNDDIGERVQALNGNVRNVLVTGGAGFIGSFLVRKLVLLYPELSIVVVDKLDYCSSSKTLADLEGCANFQFIRGDVTSCDFMSYIVRDKHIDTIVHAAAQTHVDNSFDNSFRFTSTNVMGTHVLLEVAKQHNVKRFVHVSTDEVYGQIPADAADATEDTILAPSNPYSATKAAAEALVLAYYYSFGVPVIITRSNNVYGPCQYPEKVIPKFICLLQQGRKCCIHGTGTHTRHYMYVSDVCNALDIVIHHGTVGGIYNIGSDFEISNGDLARFLATRVRPLAVENGAATRDAASESEYAEFVEDRPYNDVRYAINSTRMHNLGWRPRVSFETGIAKTVAWYAKNGKQWWHSTEQALNAHPLSGVPW